MTGWNSWMLEPWTDGSMDLLAMEPWTDEWISCSHGTVSLCNLTLVCLRISPVDFIHLCMATTPVLPLPNQLLRTKKLAVAPRDFYSRFLFLKISPCFRRTLLDGWLELLDAGTLDRWINGSPGDGNPGRMNGCPAPKER